MIHLMMRTESSKDNVTETLSLLKQELDNTLKRKLRRTKKRKLQRAKRSLRNSSCLEDTSLDCNPVFGGAFALLLDLFFTTNNTKLHQLITTYLTFR